ncbi:UDP-N-acetylmuramoyl-tripeptide--D-alanyl-D-alanine ligase [Risungbinella massiliensis]|uniref:UDP-N-acetylmuramoyl-tripeptide--D-alanyl-D- alanine ligase n=1 Tax=Risungbinella massiliensis TaxID=1329796 RepID=UPI0005CC8AE1|nr:UDP-N-acetylmuramoyl-tripeptide--D-alanyl-D-alanine ligase [Risungbinella massiliensis]
MKATTLGTLTKIVGGKLESGNPNTLVTFINHGKYKHLRPHHIYIYSKSSKWENQIKALRLTRPKALILPIGVSSFGLRIPIIRVQNTMGAVWRIGLWNWNQFKHQLRVIGITGSAGKSTTTAMVSSILRSHYRIVQTAGNLNTASYLPGYLSRIENQHNLLLLEMGMNSLNNIKRQCNIVRPHIGVVTNVGEAHAGNLGGLDYVVKAKQEMVDGVRPGGVLLLNADDLRSRKLSVAKFNGKLLRFGIDQPAEIRATNVTYHNSGMNFKVIAEGQQHIIFIPTFGKHNVYNALAAIGVARAMGIPYPSIQKGLARFETPKMRLQFLSTPKGRILINDAWNATAMKAGLEVLKNVSKGRTTVAVLGDMLELGKLSPIAHQSVGKYIAKLGVNQLVTIGPNARIIASTAIQNGMPRNRVFSYSSHEQVVTHLLRTTTPRSLIYFKASRKLHLEKIVSQIRKFG